MNFSGASRLPLQGFDMGGNWKDERWEVAVALGVGAALAAGGYLYSTLLSTGGRPRKSKAAALATARRLGLREIRTEAWVALLGTVFDVSGDPFFDARRAGVYGSWAGRDVTFLLLQLSLQPEAADNAASVEDYLEREWPFAELDVNAGEQAQRRRKLLREWYVRFHSRYTVVAQLQNRYVGADWDELRYELLPADSDANSGGKCPLGFGAKTLNHVVSHSHSRSDGAELRTITFQGKRYDVTDSSLFAPEDGQLAHFVGHDVTYALATQSTRTEDLDVIPERAYCFQEQLLLEKYRIAFARELTVLEAEKASDQSENIGTQTKVVDLHAIIEQSDDVPAEEGVRRLQQALEDLDTEQLNAVCMRTTMTPLHKAVEKRRLDLVELLVRAGADMSSRAALYDDETPLEMAHRFQLADIQTFLESYTPVSN